MHAIERFSIGWQSKSIPGSIVSNDRDYVMLANNRQAPPLCYPSSISFFRDNLSVLDAGADSSHVSDVGVMHRPEASAYAFEEAAGLLGVDTDGVLAYIRDPLRVPDGAPLQSLQTEADNEAGKAAKDSGAAVTVCSEDDDERAMLLSLFNDLPPTGGGEAAVKDVSAQAGADSGLLPADQTSQDDQNFKEEHVRGITTPAPVLETAAPSATTDAESELALDMFQARAVDLALRGHNLFITGGAGTGKSRTLHHIIAALRAREMEEIIALKRKAYAPPMPGSSGSTTEKWRGHSSSQRRAPYAAVHTSDLTAKKSSSISAPSRRMQRASSVYVTATTGLAAVPLCGTTIHNFAGIISGKAHPEALFRHLRKSRKVCQRWKRCRVLIIDEISMMEAALFESLDYIARRLRRQASVPFGGIQIIVCGDFHQLPPIVKRSEWYAIDHGTTATLWQQKQQQQQPHPSLCRAVAPHAAMPPPAQPFSIPNLDAFFASSVKDTKKNTAAIAAPQRSDEEACTHARRCLYAFQTLAWHRLQLWPVVLQIPHRQASDVLFQRTLDEVRRGELSPEGCRALASRCVVEGVANPDAMGKIAPPTLTFTRGNSDPRRSGEQLPPSAAMAIRLCATNSAVDARNAFFLSQLPPHHSHFGALPADRDAAASCVYYAVDSQVTAQRPAHGLCQNGTEVEPRYGQRMVAAASADDHHLLGEITLKIGTRVLLVSNVSLRYSLVNGSIGEVVGFLHPLEMVALVHWTMQQRFRRYRHLRQGNGDTAESVAEEGSWRPASSSSWLDELRRRGGFSDDDAAILRCIETSQGIRFSSLWWRMQHARKPSSFASSPSSGGYRPPQRSRSSCVDVHADCIPYDAMFPSRHCIDLLRVTRPPSTTPPTSHNLRDYSVLSTHLRYDFWKDDSSHHCAPDTLPSLHPHSSSRSPTDGVSAPPPWKRRLCDLTPEERHREQLPIVRFETVSSLPPSSYGRAAKYAMIAPSCYTYGDGDGSVTQREGEMPGLIGKGTASRTQLPLRYAWALTVHKSQGLTLHPVQVDMESIRSAGQAYVALSRAPSLDQLYILNFDPSVISASPVVKRFYESLVTSSNDGTESGVQSTSDSSSAASHSPVFTYEDSARDTN
ncbi:putative DNA repair and recombination helicase protein PIF5 [Leptomonas seymouri]|uniref:ATP-dependent DNA helicase n=1 Tax=Leptomonas seymouri TaxID=5684 RepID=A0A0N1P9V3_LEPSE|nr:putative DNA repair and recombination helicase protein PIF5 [Leptomonas seymouri]|eukprot:KPI82848.1 putative DNA repair and recombination helicase protein PIF5 [Leptomonas seymouri]